jgi:hypothetical protein
MAQNTGASNRLIYDPCSYEKYVNMSTSPFQYQMYNGKFENKRKCVGTKFYTPMELVDIDTELSARNKPASLCNNYKYNPFCKKSSMCLSTFDKSVPIIAPPDLCPIVHNNIKKPVSKGYTMPDTDICKK